MPDSGIAFTIGPLTVRWYGVLICLAMLLGIFLAMRLAKKRGRDDDTIVNLALIALPAAVIGARLYYCLFNWQRYAADPWDVLKIWQGGLAIHGGFIFAVLAALIYLRVKKQSALGWLDICIPSVALGQAIGRWGNYFNQEAYGGVTDLPWGILIDGQYHHPTFLYESVWNVLVFALLLWLFSRRKADGTVFAWYLICYGVGRFWIEALRTDSLMLGDSIRVAQLVSVIFIAVGGFLLLYLKKKAAAKPQKKQKRAA